MLSSKVVVRVEIRPSGRHEYAVVVDDQLQSSGTWRKRVIRSFGNAANPSNVDKANRFAAAINAGKSFLAAEIEVNRETLLHALTLLAGAAIAAAAVAWLFKNR
jgi:hypothetical protein